MPSLPERQTLSSRPRATVIGAWLEGWRRVLGAPALTLGVMASTIAVAAPLAYTLRRMLAEHLGRSQEAEAALGGWHAGWAAEFGATAPGLGRTFTHEILGFGGTLATFSGLVDREPLTPALLGGIGWYLALWVFLSGGIIDRLARSRPIRTAAFFAACGVYFVRFLRLAALIGPLYWALFAWLHPWLFESVYGRLVRDLTSEPLVVAVRASLYVVFVVLLSAIGALADFAKVRAVVEDRRSMIGAVAASWRFVRRRLPRVAGLYAVNGLTLYVILRLWLQIAPPASASPWLALLVGQLYLLVRLSAKLAFLSSEVVFFQGDLAHAQYVAARPYEWPESAGEDALRRLDAR
jgi:hypothetical protein